MQGQTGTEQGGPRTRLKLSGKVTCRGKTTGGTVADLSDAGISICLSYDIEARQGQMVEIDIEEIGRLSGIVDWARGDRIGVRLKTSSNTAAKIASLYKFFR
jgi:hypothetical protein